MAIVIHKRSRGSQHESNKNIQKTQRTDAHRMLQIKTLKGLFSPFFTLSANILCLLLHLFSPCINIPFPPTADEFTHRSP